MGELTLATTTTEAPVAEVAPRFYRRTTVAFLSDPTSYPHRPATVEAIETHMSFVFLAGERVYKMKKPIHLSFVDFTSLEARRLNCEREVALNQRLAPGVYLRTLPVVRLADERLAMGGDGVPIEWLVVMRRLDQEGLMSQAVGRGNVRPPDIDRLCDALAQFYADARRIEITPTELLTSWREAVDRTEASLTEPAFRLPRPQVGKAIKSLRVLLAGAEGLIGARARDGRIVDGHGDLRPEHVQLGPPLLVIDRLEFDERLRRLDPFDEVIFLGMECERLGAAWIGGQLVEGIKARLGDEPPAALLRFYHCYRACLRAGLSIEHLRDAKPRTPERWPRQACEYLKLAGAVPCLSLSVIGDKVADRLAAVEPADDVAHEICRTDDA